VVRATISGAQRFHVQSSQNLSYGINFNLTGDEVATFTNETLDNTYTVTNNFADAAYGIANRSNITEFYAWGLSHLSLSNLESRLAVDPEITNLESPR
jgi:hypothetical protein